MISIVDIFLSFSITLVIMFALPLIFILLMKQPKYSEKTISKKFILLFVIINAIISYIAFLIISALISNGSPSISPIFIWSIVIYYILSKYCKKEAEETTATTGEIHDTPEERALKIFEDYMKPENLSKKIFTNEHKITTSINTPISVSLNVNSKPIYVFLHKIGNSISIDYQSSKWNGEKEITITPVSEGVTLLLFKDGGFSACPILITVAPTN